MLRAGVGVLLMSAIRPARDTERAEIRALLVAAGLPVDDLDTAPVDFLVARDDGAPLAGVVGVERHGGAALLRSLAVAPSFRGRHLGAELVDAAERHARDRGVDELVLLTTTAAPFFAKRGYTTIERDDAPAAVRDSAEFRSICPASATCQRKSLRDAAARRRKRVLFVCVENANRSQMAEAFARMHGGDDVEALSAGSRPSGVINPKAVRYMAELGYDLAGHDSKSLDDIDGEFDAVVTMGCGDSCPWVPAKRREDWALTDPKHLDGDDYRAVRDDISARVRALLASL